jgi:hypothetical protein
LKLEWELKSAPEEVEIDTSKPPSLFDFDEWGFTMKLRWLRKTEREFCYCSFVVKTIIKNIALPK